MTTNSIHNAFINALLADATYVEDLLDVAGKPLAGADLIKALSKRLTPDLAKYLADHFEVVTQKLTDDSVQSGFDATVWREKDGGQVYISMRGSEGTRDFIADGDLSVSGLARRQVMDMVNWWLQGRAGEGSQAAQIKFEVVEDGEGFERETNNIIAAPTVAGNGKLSSVTSVIVNGHSLGGHLATAFTRLFSGTLPILHTYTYNTATFNPLSPTRFAEIASVLGLGPTAFPTNAADTNFRAMHGPDLTTQNLTLGQIGLLVDLFNEETPFADLLSVPNHFMYKLTDALALGDALAQLDPTLTLAKLNSLFEVGSDKPAASIEGVMDALRKALAGPGIEALKIGDAGDSPLSRVTFHATLSALQKNPIFKDLVGKLRIESPPPSIATLARYDFGALIALQDLSPLYISGTTAEARDQLAALWQAGRAADYSAWTTDKTATTPSTFTDNWLSDRAALLQALVIRNQKDETSDTLATDSAPADRNLQFQWYGADPLPGEILPRLATLTETKPYYADRPVQRIAFGDDGANAMLGTDSSLGDHLYGGGGADTLDGKAGNDYLEGGTGTDTYTFTDTFGKDTILDTDGLGSIQIGGTTLTGGKRLAEGLWESDDKTIIFTQQDSGNGVDLIIGPRTAAGAASVSGTITVKNWQAGQLGLNLPGAETPTPAPAPVRSFDLSSEAGLDAYREANTAYSSHNLLIQNAATAINRGIAAIPIWRSSFARGGSGDDVIEGGVINAISNTIYSGGVGDDRIYANTTTSLADAITWGDKLGTVSIDSSHYVLDGGAGTDQIIGSDARDVIFGGEGDDTLVGGAGGDVIIADGDAGGLLGGFDASATDPLIVDGPATNIGSTASLRIDHTGVSLGLTDSNSVGQRLVLESSPGTAYLNPLYSADFTALQNLNDTDIRGLGYSTDVTNFGGVSYGGELTTNQSVGQHTTYLGSSVEGALSTNKATGNDVIYAGAGDDIVNAGAGNDIVLAADGKDNVAGYEGDDYIDGGAGNDLLLGDAFVSGVGPNSSTTPNVDFYSARLLVNGYSLDTSLHGKDYIDGGAGDDQIQGGGKADLLYGGVGKDVIVGDDQAGRINGAAAGDDVLDGGEGDDILVGGAGKDLMTGGDGEDILVGDWQQDDMAGGGADMLDGGAGNDVLYGAAGDDLLFGGAGNDVLHGDATAVAYEDKIEVKFGQFAPISAAAGDDRLDGGEGDDELSGNAGNDTLIGGAGKDVLEGGDGNDDLAGGEGDDMLMGGAGKDTLFGGAGLDRLEGGAGDDTYVFGMGDAVPQNSADTIRDTEGKNVIRLDGVTLSDMGITKSGIAGSLSWALQFGLQTNADGSLSASNVVLIDDGQVNHTIDALEVGGQRIDFDTYVGQNMQSVMQNSATQDGQHLLGGARSDTLALTKNNGLIVAGRGNDDITLGGEHNVVLINRGDGHDVVSGDLPVGSSGSNAIRFGAGIAASDLQVSTVGGGAVQVRVVDGDAGVTLKGGSVSELLFADGAPAVDLAGLVQSYLNTKMTSTNDWIEGSLFADRVDGGAGNDVLMGYQGHDTISGGSGDDFLFGDAGDDILDGGAGQDILSGGDGSDTLASDGEDYLDGGAGDDLYRVTLSTPAGTVNRAISQINDGQGHNTLRVENGPQDLGQYVVFTQGGSIFLAAGRLGLIILGANVDLAQFSVANAAGDKRTLATLVAQQNPQGVLRSGTWSAEAGVQWTQDLGSSQLLKGGAADDRLEGGVGDDQLWGMGGNDHLTGGAGRDILVGGTGTNTYVLGVGAGSDVIRPTDGETGVLRFEGTAMNALRSSIEDNDLLINAGSADQVRIEGYANKAQLAANWSVVIGEQTTTLGAFAAATEVLAQASLAARKQAFVETQLTQLRMKEQYPWMGAAPLAVTPSALQMAEGVTLELPSYLSRESIRTTSTQTTLVPIYVPATSVNSGEVYEFWSLAYIESKFKPTVSGPDQIGWSFEPPPGYREVIGPVAHGPDDLSQDSWGLMGVMIPVSTQSADPVQQSADPVFVGWSTNVTIVTKFTDSDTAKQFLVQGTSADDVVRSSSNQRFRGVVETGQGDDSIMFSPEYWDSAKLDMGSYQQVEYASHGMGAWIDAGSGNDTVRGTDGEDVIIGGTGSDVLDGNSGADTYLISAQSGEVDYIKDTATAESWLLDVYGGVVNQDVVEFDSTVKLTDLSYEWNPQAGESGPKTLDLFNKGQLFLQIDYWPKPTYRVGSGVEQFKFSDGTMWGVDALLGRLPVKTAAPSNLVLDASASVSTLSYQWVASESPGVVKLVLFQDGQTLLELDYDSSVANAAQVRSLDGLTDFELASGEVLTLQALLSSIRLEPALPQLDNPLPDLVATEDLPFALSVPGDAFIDTQGRTLHFAASLQDGAVLPEWLYFDAHIGQFTGTPGNAQVGTLQIQVTAINDAGLAISDVFALEVLNTNDAPIAFADAAAVTEDTVDAATGNVLANDADVDQDTVLQVTNAGTLQGHYGALSLGADGGYSYALNNDATNVQSLGRNAVVTDTFAYTVQDNAQTNPFSATAALTVTLQGVNDGPQAVSDTAQAVEDSSLLVTGSVLGNDTDVDAGDVLTVATPGLLDGTYGDLTLAADGSYTYALNQGALNVQSLAEGQQVVDSFAYTTTDGLATSSATLAVTVTGTNDAPIAFADAAAVTEDIATTATGNVLANDADIDQGTVLQVANAGTLLGQYGALSLGADGAYTYSLNNGAENVQSLGRNAVVTDTFAYTVQDNALLNPLSATAVLTVTLQGSNDGPVAYSDVAQAVEDSSALVSGNVLVNDTDVDVGDVLAVATAGTLNGTYGDLTVAENGSYSYALNQGALNVQSLAEGQQVTDGFAYTTTDGRASSSATLAVMVTGTNDAPIAFADAAAVTEDTAITATGDVLANDADIDQGTVLQVANAGTLQGQYGALSMAADGGYHYVLNSDAPHVQALGVGQTVTEVFAYTVKDDGSVPLTASSTVSITITGTNDAPVVAAAIATQVARENQAFAFAVPEGTFTDVDNGDVMAYSAHIMDALGHAQGLPNWLSFDASTRSFTGTPGSTAGGSFEFEVTATDLSGASASSRFTLNISDEFAGTGANAYLITGNNYANVLNGTSLNETITGKGGADTLYGGAGNDTLTWGVDTWWGDDSYARNVGSPGLAGSGEDIDIAWMYRSLDTFDGGTGTDTLVGTSGDDAIVLDDGQQRIQSIERIEAGAGDDVVDLTSSRFALGDITVDAGTGSDVIWSSSGNDTLIGGSGNDVLDGGAGVDRMVGGTGHDTYYVDNTADLVLETLNEGVDRIYASANYTMAAHVEYLTLTGSADLSGTGNDLDNTITGNSGNNVLIGGAGYDMLVGQNGADTLDGGLGVDEMRGGKGNDTYVVDHSRDEVIESHQGGTDLVRSGINYSLGAHLENLTLMGNATQGMGNSLDNILSANDLGNALWGESGADTLLGGAGNDILDGGKDADWMAGGAGNDTYLVRRGYGKDTIQENDATAGNVDVVLFGPGIKANQLWFKQVANDLEVSVLGSDDMVTFSDWYLGNAYHVEQFKTSDGKMLLDSQVQNLVSAMAAFSPPVSGHSTLVGNYSAALTPIIVANWQ